MNISLTWVLLTGGWAISEFAILLRLRTRSGGGKVSDRGSLIILWPTITASISLGTWFGETHRESILSTVQWLGPASVAVFLMGLAIRWIAIFTLGKAFSVNIAIRDAQRLQTNGIFHVARHPSYSGLLLIVIAIGLHTRNWIALGIVVVPITAALLYRIHVEERALAEAFGDEYRAYCQATKRLIPGIY